MITGLILSMLYYVILLFTSPLRLLPDATLPSGLTSAIATANTYIRAIDFVFPVSTFLTILGLILGIETFIILFKIINWLIRKIPGIN